MLRPSPEQLSVLRPFERFAFAVADTMNRTPPLKRAAQAFLGTVGTSWVYYSTNHITHLRGLEHVRGLTPNRGVLFVGNHRSFFDMYVMSSHLLRETSWVKKMFFPVRGDYFYERPDGILVNAIMSAWAMYPPVMRRPEARPFNEYMVDLVSELLSEPGVATGMHPEGTRNKGPDPYALLPAQIGVGQMIHRARPIVMPFFVLGLLNDLPRQVSSNFDGTGQAITLSFGPPMDLDALLAEPPRLRTYKKIAEHTRQVLVDMGADDRAYRARERLPRLSPR